jgi:hypothetical protein
MSLPEIGIAVSAVSSAVLLLIQIVKFRIERSHLVVRLSIGRPNFEEGATAYLTAAVFNQGRSAFIDGLWLKIGEDQFWIGSEGRAREKQPLPVDLATGRSLRIGFDLTRYEVEVEAQAEAFGDKITYTDEDLPKMRLRVTDGEGHDHWTSLTKESIPNVKMLIKERKRLKEEWDRKQAAIADGASATANGSAKATPVEDQ